MKRVFIGYKCDPFPRILQTVEKLRSRFKGSSAKWTSSGSWHITSYFIGNANDQEIEILKEIITETAKNTRPFSVSVTGIGFFPSADRPKVLWAGVTPKDDLTKLYHKTGALLRTAGFKTGNRSYTPHITLARIKHCHDPEIAKSIESYYSGMAFGTLHINDIILYESRLFPSGAQYVPIYTAKIS